MQTIMFYVLAVVALFSAMMVISRKQPVQSVLFLVLTFFCLAGLYVLLGAQFLAAIQIVVYAGAIMVLFLFVVMMLNLRDPDNIEGRSAWQGFGVIVGLGMLLVILAFIARSPSDTAMQDSALKTEAVQTAIIAGELNSTSTDADVENVENSIYRQGRADSMGGELFTSYLLPFEIAGVLLLAAVIGAVGLAKKRRA